MTSPFNYEIQEFDKPLCYAADWRRGVQKQYTSEKIASLTPKEHALKSSESYNQSSLCSH